MRRARDDDLIVLISKLWEQILADNLLSEVAIEKANNSCQQASPQKMHGNKRTKFPSQH
jgi:hypothetical protein